MVDASARGEVAGMLAGGRGGVCRPVERRVESARGVEAEGMSARGVEAGMSAGEARVYLLVTKALACLPAVGGGSV